MADSLGPTAPPRAQRAPALIITILILAAVVSSFEATMMYTALPGIIEQFHSTPSAAGWILTGFLLVGAASAAISGRLGDAFGRRNVLIVVLLASVVGSAVSLFAHSLAVLIAGRSIQGLAGGLVPLCVGILRENLPRRNLPVAVATVAGAAMCGGAAGNIVAGNIYDAWGWHYIFVVSLVLALVTAAGAVLLPAAVSRTGFAKIDWLGGILFAPGIALAMYGIHESSNWGWDSGKTLGFIAGGLLVLAAWVAWEYFHDNPLLNVRYFASRKIGLTLVVTMLVSFGTLGISGFLGQLVMQMPKIAPVGLGLSAGVAGDISFACSLLGFAIAPLSGRLSRGGRSRNAFLIGAAFGLAAAVLSALLLGTVAGWIVSQLVLTCATGFMLSSLPNLIVEGVHGENTSEVSGFYMVTQNAFAAVGTSVGTTILSQHLIQGTPFSTHASYNILFAIIAVGAVLAFVVALFIRKGTLGETAGDLGQAESQGQLTHLSA
ncbi:MFS transporter [Actinoplanes sp. L3-i22]|uniref:MFS transporter n=1 Tax=Actinoplanes sp. L3-i22 TaxID=2836373 RepID=UPI001C755A88|nr:MFS transporter [Actinoplanes sp. L3-i22]BCY09738.1 MFS transporter [Actinoplanes sp. L3-i22]